MSQKAMTVPEGAEKFKFAELVLCLPRDWKLGEKEFQNDENYFPIRWLKTLARLPHEYNSWLCYGHTIPNGDPASPFTKKTKLAGWILDFPLLFGEEFPSLLSDNKQIHFWMMTALTNAEMDLKLQKGTDPLFDLFEKKGVGQVLELKRKSVV